MLRGGPFVVISQKIMESEVRDILQREIEEIEAQLTHRIATWQVMKDDYERWRAERRAEYGESVYDDELEWEKGASVREYHSLYIEPLEERLREKRKNKETFN